MAFRSVSTAHPSVDKSPFDSFRFDFPDGFRRVFGRVFRSIIAVTVACALGCGGDESSEGTSGSGGPAVVVRLDGAKYLRPAHRIPPLDSANGGLAALGDIDGDDRDDFVVAYSAQGRGAAVDHGWIEARSGRDGKSLWQVGGKSKEEAAALGDDSGYKLGAIALVDDLNGDGVPDIYARDDWSKSSALLYSGKDGQRLGRYAIDRSGYMERPLLSRDVNDDGKSDLLFTKKTDGEFDVLALSGIDLSPIESRIEIQPEAETRVEWLLPRYADVDGDGVRDSLLRRHLKQSHTDPVYAFEFLVLSGDDFSVLNRFETDRPRIDGETHHAAAGDLDGDAIEDILMTSSTGAGADHHASFIRAISGSDGSTLWQVLGTQLKGGRETHLVEVETGETTALQPDVEFEGVVLSTPDLDGDGVRDAATVARAPGSGGARKSVLRFSGADGKPLAPLRFPEGEGKLFDSLIVLESATEEGTPAIAVSAKTSDGETVVVIFPLPAR